jgi:two-component system LytT family response regulator
MTTAPSLRVLVADDEALARQRLLDLLNVAEDTEVVGTAGTGREAVDAIRSLEPDLVFLDVQMPGLTGLDVVREVGPEQMPVTVFVTAYDQHALKAFELAAVDYLLKPFEDERFRQALRRARDQVRLREVDALQGRLMTLLQAREAESTPSKSSSPSTADNFLERIAVEMRGQVRVVPVERIDYIEADGPYAELHAGEDTFVIRERMQTLEDRLDPDAFLRIHRSTIVQLDRVESLLVGSGGDYAVRLADGARLRVSRSRYEALARRLGLDAL